MSRAMKYNVPLQAVRTPDLVYREFEPVDPLTIYFLQSNEPCPISELTREQSLQNPTCLWHVNPGIY
jgi:hypothetical protein